MKKLKFIIQLSILTLVINLSPIVQIAKALPEELTITQYPIVNKASDQSIPAIYGNKVVWGDWRNGNPDIYLADITDPANPVEYQITTNNAGQYAPAIYDNKVIWLDNRNGNHDIYLGEISDPAVDVSDNNPPVFFDFEGGNGGINISDGQFITTNPFKIKVKPVDEESGIQLVEFYVDNNLLCTDTSPDSEGIYSCDWDTSKYHSTVRVVAFDNSENSATILRNATVDPKLYLTVLPKAGK